MKTILFPIFCAVLLLAGCESSNPQQRQAEAQREAEEKKPPYVGMTKAQATARYGEPKSTSVTEAGEQWTYYLNEGDVIGSHLIPFNFSPTQPNIAVLTFGPDGKVKQFVWNNPQKDD